MYDVPVGEVDVIPVDRLAVLRGLVRADGGVEDSVEGLLGGVRGGHPLKEAVPDHLALRLKLTDDKGLDQLENPLVQTGVLRPDQLLHGIEIARRPALHAGQLQPLQVPVHHLQGLAGVGRVDAGDQGDS